MKKIIATTLLSLAIFSASASASASASVENVSTENIVASALDKLGHKFKRHLDIEQEPHLVLVSNISGVKQTAIYFDDCNYRNQCEDVTFYSDLGKIKVSDTKLNAWNHINSKMRSKVFRNNDGTVGMSMTVSFIDHEDVAAIDMLTGLFILESELLAHTVNK
jgi:hypothetical protein